MISNVVRFQNFTMSTDFPGSLVDSSLSLCTSVPDQVFSSGSCSFIALSENAWDRMRRIRVWSSSLAVSSECTLLGGGTEKSNSLSKARLVPIL